MTVWTKENLTIYREQMGWRELDDQLIEQVLAILNDAQDTLESLENVSWTEPDIRFSVADLSD